MSGGGQHCRACACRAACEVVQTRWRYATVPSAQWPALRPQAPPQALRGGAGWGGAHRTWALSPGLANATKTSAATPPALPQLAGAAASWCRAYTHGAPAPANAGARLTTPRAAHALRRLSCWGYCLHQRAQLLPGSHACMSASHQHAQKSSTTGLQYTDPVRSLLLSPYSPTTVLPPFLPQHAGSVVPPGRGAAHTAALR